MDELRQDEVRDSAGEPKGKLLEETRAKYQVELRAVPREETDEGNLLSQLDRIFFELNKLSGQIAAMHEDVLSVSQRSSTTSDTGDVAKPPPQLGAWVAAAGTVRRQITFREFLGAIWW